MRPRMMRKRLRSRLAFAVVRHGAVRVAAAGRECIAVVAVPKARAVAMSYSH